MSESNKGTDVFHEPHCYLQQDSSCFWNMHWFNKTWMKQSHGKIHPVVFLHTCSGNDFRSYLFNAFRAPRHVQLNRNGNREQQSLWKIVMQAFVPRRHGSITGGAAGGSLALNALAQSCTQNPDSVWLPRRSHFKWDSERPRWEEHMVTFRGQRWSLVGWQKRPLHTFHPL